MDKNSTTNLLHSSFKYYITPCHSFINCFFHIVQLNNQSGLCTKQYSVQRLERRHSPFKTAIQSYYIHRSLSKNCNNQLQLFVIFYVSTTCAESLRAFSQSLNIFPLLNQLHNKKRIVLNLFTSESFKLLKNRISWPLL